ncbi:hypothetical protein ACLOJK_000877 [Asimina triloba]
MKRVTISPFLRLLLSRILSLHSCRFFSTLIRWLFRCPEPIFLSVSTYTDLVFLREHNEMVSVEYSGLVITHVIHKAALVLAVFQWIFSWAFCHVGLSNSSADDDQQQIVSSPSSSSSSSSSQTPHVTAQAIRDSLHVSTYGDVADRLPDGSATCAVCLNELRCQDKVWELRNCCHVFHKRCLDRWLDHDEHKTCPLCRAPLMSLAMVMGLERTEPSWAVERLLYLFGDDLLCASS